MNDIINVLEAALFAANAPLSAETLKKLVCPHLNLGEIRALLGELEAHYADRGIHLVQVASGYRFQVAPKVGSELTALFEDNKPSRFSRAFMETLALIAYRQPITRGEIEEVRGVVVSTQIMKTLTELDWVRIVGHKEVPGKPALYATTKAFLDFFNLKKLEELPALADLTELKDLNVADAQLNAELAPLEETEELIETSEVIELVELEVKENEHAV